MFRLNYGAWVLIGAMLFITSVSHTQGIVINEFMASNGSTVADEDGDFEDWIELYNAGSEPVDLEDWGLTDDPSRPFRWRFPSAIVEPGEYLLVWASNKDRSASQSERPNGILRQVYMDIPGTSVDDLINDPTFPDNPTMTNLVTTVFEAPTNFSDNYGQRMHGFILAPVTGYYVFWISGDDNSRLYLSSDENSANAVLIAEVPGWTDPREWNKYPADQQSDPIWLEAGHYYYISALMKEGTGGDNLAVRWQLPDATIEEPIPASRLYVDSKQLHTNFAISAAGEPLQLTAPDETVVDAVGPVALIRDVSYGRATDGGAEWVYFLDATPGASNDTSIGYLGIMPKPEFSHTAGYYADPFALTLNSSEPEADIYFTLDGSAPDAGNLSGTSYEYRNQYPSGPMLTREYRSYLYQDALAIDESAAFIPGLSSINTENSGGGGGTWSIEGSELVQNSSGTPIRLFFGDTSWGDYEMTLQAQKTGGAEGFLIIFRAPDSGNYYWFNIAGWNNAQHAIEKEVNGSRGVVSSFVSGSVNTGQWYDIRVRCEGNNFQLWLGTDLIYDFTDTDNPHLTGQIGLGTWATQARFRNIEVRTLGGDLLYSGLPNLTDVPQTPAVVVRARTHQDGYIPSEIATHTYFLGPDAAGSHTLPVVSLAVQEPDFFSYETGIYVAGINHTNNGNYWMRGELWERPAHFTLFETDGSVVLSQNIGTRIHGGWTRNFPQKALRLYARSGYGEGEFDYPIFPDFGTEVFKRLILRNSGNDNYQTLFRDAMMQRLIEHLPIDTQAYRPAVMYLNGEYWGLHNFRERFDKYYLHYKYGVDPEQLDILEFIAHVSGHLIKQGDTVHYDQMLSYIDTHDLSVPAHYAHLQTLMDTENFVDNNVSHIYFNNRDWPGNNNDWWRVRTDEYKPDAPHGHDGRWRWMLFDTDFGFGHNGDHTVDTMAFAAAVSNEWNNPQWATFLLRNLLQNETFRTDFINRYADLLNTAFLPARVVSVIDEMQAVIAPEMANHIARWNRPGSIGDWNNQVNVMRNFANQRPAFARTHLRDYFSLGADRQLTLNVSDIEHGFVRVNRTDINAETPGVNAAAPFPWSGLYFDSVPITVTAVPLPGYVFSHWDGPAGIDPAAETLTLSLTGPVSLTAHFEEAPTPTLMHYWSFNNTLALLVPTYSFGGGTLDIVPGEITVVTSGTGQSFAGENNRLDEPTGAHLRINDPNGAVMTLRIPTIGYESIVMMLETRRSGQGAGTQHYSYSIDGVSFIPFRTITVFDAAPTLHTFDFTEITGADNNINFAVRVEFEQGGGGTAGNNRFDNITVDGIPLSGVNQPPYLLDPLPFTETLENASAAVIDLSAYIIDPDDDVLIWSAESNKPFVAQAALSGSVLTITPQMRGDAVITVTADDGVNPPLGTTFRVLVYPAAHTLRLGTFGFDYWSSLHPEHTFPENILFLQSDVTDPNLTQPLEYAYFIPHDDYHADDQDKIGYPYMTTGRTRLNGLFDEGIAFINTGRGRDLGGVLMAIDTTGLEGVRVSWLGGTILENFRRYAIRLQYRVGIDGPFVDVLDGDEQPVEYVVEAGSGEDGHTQPFELIALPTEAVDQPYVQLLWRYYHIDVTTGARAQLRLDDIVISGVLDIFENLNLFAQWWLVTDCELYNHCGGADLTRDGTVNLEDFAVIASQWVGQH